MKNKMDKIEFAENYLKVLKRCLDLLPLEQIADLMDYLDVTYLEDRKIFIIGNGGSAATASHMACDLGKNIVPANENNKTCFNVLSLVDNVPWITAIANDHGYENIFSKQLENLIQAGDLLIVISGSGNSPNVVKAAHLAKAKGANVVGLLGFDGGRMKEIADISIVIESDQYGHIEDVHMILDHLITAYFTKKNS